MEGVELHVDIDRPFQAYLDEGWVRRVVAETLTAEQVDSPAELSLVITDDARIRQLNRDYRETDEATDVLAFALLEDSGVPFVNPPDGVLHLGEVVVSYPRAVEQAGEHQHSVQRELALLVVHGVLHLLGLEHEEPEDEQKMRAEEQRVLGVLAL
jgi:probable rRNA maturation factor